MGEKGFRGRVIGLRIEEKGRSMFSLSHLLRVVKHVLHLGLIPWDDTIIQFLKVRYIHHGALSSLAKVPALGTGDRRKIN